jgi:Thioredoxin domain
MAMKPERAKPILIQLFIATDEDSCTAVKHYLETWLEGQDDTVSLEIIPILENPARLVQAGINYTPALVINGEVVSQGCAIDEVDALLKGISK